MSLVGTYHSSDINATFVVDSANDANGEASGSIEIDGITIPVKIHYHYENNVGPVTDLWLAGGLDNPNRYVGGAGRTEAPAYASIRIAGGYPTENDVSTFDGTFHRQ